MPDTASPFEGDRLAKVIARSGLCSRRDAEVWIKEGRVAVNGKVIRTPAFNVTAKDKVKVDGQPLADRQGTRVWLYHKPQGLVVTEKDPEGRPTIFETLEEQGLPRVVSIGRLDINTEGLLLLTNDGGLKRVLELPATGWLRRYRVRAFGSITQPQLDALKEGIEVDGVSYGPIEATLEREQGSNVWLLVGLREGKNREVKNVLASLGLTVNRLIRVSFGPFQLSDLPIGGIEVVKARILREQLGKRLADEAGVDFDSEMPEPAATAMARGAANPALRAAKPGAEPAKQRKAMADRTERFRFTDKPEQRPEDRPPAKDRPGSRFPRKPPREVAPPERRGPPRKVFNADGSETVFEAKSYGRPPKPAAGAEGKPPFKKDFGDKPRTYGDKPKGDFGDRPKRPYSGRPAAEGTDRPKRAYGDKPKGDFGDRPKRPYSGRPATDGADRPKRAYGDKPKGDFGDRPKRPYSGRPAADGADRPKRAYGDKPKGDFGDRPKRPYSGRPAADGAAPKRTYGAKPGAAPRGDFSDRPKRPYTGRPAADAGAPKRTYGAKPGGARPGAGDGPKRPRGSGPTGDRPRRPRPPKI
jgi:23S rRNA pseudouridine2605 synthase